ncbi:MAG TPA: SPOR domain-containing protein [Azospirillum sp.]|nr:SPOR domain-containing protein [Azospirillum sp.]
MKKLLLVVVALLLLGLAFAGGYFLAGGALPGWGGATGAEAPATAGDDPAKEGGKADPGKDAKAEAAAPPAVTVRPAATGRKEEARFSIELGVFRSADNAQLFAAELNGRGLPVEIVETVDAAGQTWQRVRAGAFSDRWQAEARLREYERIAGLGGVIVAEPVLPPVAPAKGGGGE